MIVCVYFFLIISVLTHCDFWCFCFLLCACYKQIYLMVMFWYSENNLWLVFRLFWFVEDSEGIPLHFEYVIVAVVHCFVCHDWSSSVLANCGLAVHTFLVKSLSSTGQVPSWIVHHTNVILNTTCLGSPWDPVHTFHPMRQINTLNSYLALIKLNMALEFLDV